MSATPTRTVPTRTIDGETYTCPPLPAAEALPLLTRATRVLGPASPILAALVEGEEDDAMARMVRAAGDFFTRMDNEGVATLVFDMVATCRVAGQPPDPGRITLRTALQLFLFGVEAQFGDFFDGNPLVGLILAGREAPSN